jgi:cell division protein FtsB
MVSLNNALNSSRKENKTLISKLQVDSQIRDYAHVKEECVKLQAENSELRSENKGLKSNF